MDSRGNKKARNATKHAESKSRRKNPSKKTSVSSEETGEARPTCQVSSNFEKNEVNPALGIWLVLGALILAVVIAAGL